MRAIVVGAVTAAATLMTSVGARSSAAQQTPAPPLDLVSAVQSTLARHPRLEAQRQQVRISEGRAQEQAGVFDTRAEWAASTRHVNTPLTDAERIAAVAAGVPVSALSENAFAVSGSAARLLRSGIALGPSLTVDRLTDNLQTLDGINRTRVSFDVTVPLLRGKGRDIVAGPEVAASIDVDASQFDLGQQASDLVLGTATSYWQLVASLRQLEIVTQSEARGRTYVDAVRTLADADRLPRSEVNQAQANFDSRAAGRYLLEQQVAEARSALALAMGLTRAEIALLAMPADAFPDSLGQTVPSEAPEAAQKLIELALTKRADYLAAGKVRDAADVLRRVAADGARPQFDLTLSTGYSSLQAGRGAEDFLGSLVTHASGPDAFAGVRWTRPFANNAARGAMAQAEAAYQQAVLLQTERGRIVAVDVLNALTALQNGVQRLARSAEAIRGFRAALEGEADKLRLGVGSLTDLLTVEGRLTDALLDRVGAEQAYAVGVARLRYATGTLVDPAAVLPPARVIFFQPLNLAGPAVPAMPPASAASARQP